jgi:hypothetical protein
MKMPTVNIVINQVTACYQMISRYTRKLWDTSFAQEAKSFGVLKQAFP